MTPLQAKLHQLQQIYTRRDASWVTDFEGALDEVAMLGESACIPGLLRILDDGSEFDEVLFSIVHSVEGFPDSAYVPELLDATEDLAQRAPRWSRILYMRVLNNDSTRAVLSSELVRQPASTRAAVAGILADIRARRPELAGRVDDVSGTS